MFDKMTDEELIVGILQALGYKNSSPVYNAYWWSKGDDILCGVSAKHILHNHAFTMEVKRFMRVRGWSCGDWTGLIHGVIRFSTENHSGGFAIYVDMDEQPRAVYIAALKALNA